MEQEKKVKKKKKIENKIFDWFRKKKLLLYYLLSILSLQMKMIIWDIEQADFRMLSYAVEWKLFSGKLLALTEAG